MKQHTRFALRFGIDYLMKMQDNPDWTSAEKSYFLEALRLLAACDCCEACNKRKSKSK